LASPEEVFVEPLLPEATIQAFGKDVRAIKRLTTHASMVAGS